MRGGKPAHAGPGYALIEVMIAVCLLAFVVVSLYASFVFGFGLVKLSQENLRADQILLEKLETLRVYDWTRISGGSYFPTNFTAWFSGTNGAARGAVYTGTIAITPAPVSESYADTLRQVTVSLTWVSGGAARNRSMTTLVSKYGIDTYKP